MKDLCSSWIAVQDLCSSWIAMKDLCSSWIAVKDLCSSCIASCKAFVVTDLGALRDHYSWTLISVVTQITEVLHVH